MNKTRRRETDPPKQIADAIRGAWPGGVIDMSVDWDDAPFWEKYPKLKTALSHIRRATILYEREPEGAPRWAEPSNPDEDPPDWHDEPRSYYVFFVATIDEPVIRPR